VNWYITLPCSSPANIARWLGDIPHPTVWVVILFVSWICNFEILHLQARHIIHRDFKIHWDWSNLLPALCSIWVGKCYFCNHVMFYTSLEFLDRPFSVFFLHLEFIWLSLYSLWQFKCYIRRCFRDGEFHDNLCRKVILRELCSHLNCELKLVLGHLVYEWINTERSGVLSIDSVIHNEKFTIWRVNCHCFHCFKVTHIHTLVEIAVIKHYTANLACCWLSYLEITVED